MKKHSLHFDFTEHDDGKIEIAVTKKGNSMVIGAGIAHAMVDEEELNEIIVLATTHYMVCGLEGMAGKLEDLVAEDRLKKGSKEKN